MDSLGQKEIEKCKHCGKPFKPAKFTLPEFLAQAKGYNEIVHYFPDCDCEEKLRAEQERKREAQQKQEALNKRIENSLITPHFKKKKFENLTQTEEVIYCKNYADNFVKASSKGIQMIGNVGTGKTTLLAAICNELIEKGYACLFTTFSELLENFLSYSSANSGNIADKLKWLTEYDFVVLDDIGRESYNTERKKEIAFRIIDTLLNYEIITCFSANPEMIEKLKGMPEQKAMIDRLKDICPNKLTFRGESLRGLNNV